MSAQIIDGKAVAAAQRDRIATEVADLTAAGVQPGLAAVLVGDDPASHVYVGMKEKDCAAVGMRSLGARLPADVGQEALHAEIDRLNEDPAVHGIIVQMPLPDHLDEVAAQDRIAPEKDVDGLHPHSQGQLMRGVPTYVPATPLGCQVLLEHYDIPLSGANVVIVGRSTLVGRPLAMLLSRKGVDATVTCCHSRTKDLAAHTRAADIVIMAVGVARMLTADMVREGAVVIDVGITRGEDGKLVGDVDYEAVAEVAGWITPVPGGVGPMTRAMLLENTLRAARTQSGQSSS
ncbi:bifunctional 5,10-methylenetetrahydrofolate dehydrogenase/5,10-methenyltetrahydrofolate cyclohydrolase [Euzebya rosea]|uniref:bifunctional 5,10-methylenetetrahydrofolate dehydrogenase/5,10-methenyltetrahydrofolate cyclohydrolase n=1 Tax=Euzebya rosea TaxID=2052804 RepID=UPI000D3E81DA|nr:bifunctional 5,10-methylenetetrahydrofolate dehydrogenase/5,10-methenyltetrahydrofolate cyclohydrolase [Euzebya rosea]